MKRWFRALVPCSLFVPTLLGATAAANPETVARDTIWSKELSIYTGRGTGSLDFYIDNASPRYLGWPPTSASPFPLSQLRREGDQIRRRNREKIVSTFKGFTLSGTTAVIYYVNHRTMMADGTPVDQTYDNIHVWTYEDSSWKVIGGMSRLVAPSPQASTTGGRP